MRTYYRRAFRRLSMSFGLPHVLQALLTGGTHAIHSSSSCTGRPILSALRVRHSSKPTAHRGTRIDLTGVIAIGERGSIRDLTSIVGGSSKPHEARLFLFLWLRWRCACHTRHYAGQRMRGWLRLLVGHRSTKSVQPRRGAVFLWRFLVWVHRPAKIGYARMRVIGVIVLG